MKNRGILMPRFFLLYKDMRTKKKKLQFNIITIFPNIFDSYLGDSIIGRAIKSKKIGVNFFDPRSFTKDKHKKVDDKPYGGGPGMVMQADPVLKAIEKAVGRKKNVKLIMFSPSGKQFDTAYAKKLAENYDEIILISGRYEGIDARVKKILKPEEISVGPYVLTGGEIPAMLVIDSVSRQIKGVLGNEFSPENERVASPETYTRPEILKYKKKEHKVPKVLLSGNHKDIEEWRKKKSK